MEDRWEFAYRGLQGAPKTLRDSHELFLEEARGEGIRSNAELFDYVAARILTIRRASCRQVADWNSLRALGIQL